MQPGLRTHFFLGADSRYGYCSLFGSVLPGEECAVKYIIKGGHTFGKNVFLGRLADRLQNAGYNIECYRSAVMPEYLDGLYIPGIKTAFLDGDMPNELSALYPGAVETYMDIGAIYDSAGLREQRDNIIALSHDLSDAREQLYRYLAAAGEIKDNIDAAVRTDRIAGIIRKRVKGVSAREFKCDKTRRGAVSLRFMSADDSLCYASAEALCRRICVLDNDFGLSSEMLSGLRDAAVAAGHDVIICLDPFEPDKIGHLLIPELSLAFVSSTSEHQYQGETYKRIRLDALPREELPRYVKLALKADRRLLRELLAHSAQAREDVRRLWLELDAIYTSRMRPDGAAELADGYADAIISESAENI